MRASACATWTAPTTTMRTAARTPGGTPPLPASRPGRPVPQEGLPRQGEQAGSPLPPGSPACTSGPAPVARFEPSTTDRFDARSPRSAASRLRLIRHLHVDLRFPAAGQAHLPGPLVGDPVAEPAGASRRRSPPSPPAPPRTRRSRRRPSRRRLPALVHRELASGGAQRRAPGRGHRGERHPEAGVDPGRCLLQHLPVARPGSRLLGPARARSPGPRGKSTSARAAAGQSTQAAPRRVTPDHLAPPPLPRRPEIPAGAAGGRAWAGP